MYSYSYSTSGSTGNGGAISLKAANGSITTAALLSVSNSAVGSAGNGGVINLEANNGNITVGDLFSFSYSPVDGGGNGGAITFTANGNITTGGMNSEAGDTGKSGDITLTSHAGAIDTTSGAITSEIREGSNGTGRAGAIAFTAQGDVQTALLNASAEKGDGGNIQLTSTHGAIDTTRGTLATDSRSGNTANIQLQALNNIRTADIISTISSSDKLARGGDITLISKNGEVRVDGKISTDTYGSSKGGDINITTGSLSLTDGAQLSTSTFGQGNGGTINITASDTVSLNRASAGSDVGSTAIGEGGDINITTGSLSIKGNGLLTSRTSGPGNAGSINIIARNTVSLDDQDVDGDLTGFSSVVRDGSTGKGGDINIQAEHLSIRNNAALNADVEANGRGKAGDIYLDVKGTILLTSDETYAQKGESARITLAVQGGGIGSGGTLKVKAGSLVLRNGGIIKNSTQGQGNAGNIFVNADVVDISGSVPSSGLPSGLFTSTNTTGKAGDIIIDTQTFRIADGAALSARTKGDGQGGTIRVNATNTFEAVNGGQLVSTTSGKGQAGNIFVYAKDSVTISGTDINYNDRIAKFPNNSQLIANDIRETGAASGLIVNTTGSANAGNIEVTAGFILLDSQGRITAESASAGDGGNITVNANVLKTTDGGQLVTSTNSSGNAGNITVNAKEVQLSGSNSGLFAQTSSTGNAGKLILQPLGNEQNLKVNFQNGAQISASTSSSGTGGSLTITAPESITITGDGSIISAETTGAGNGGDLTLSTGKLVARDGAQVTVSSANSGKAGNLTVDANSIKLTNRAKINADTTGGGGNIFLNSPLLLLRHGSSITTNASGNDITAGNITIDAKNGFIVAVPSENSDIRADSENFRGGNVTINNAAGIFGIQSRKEPSPQTSDITAKGATPDLSGTVELNTPDIDLNSGLVELPSVPVDTQVAQGCNSPNYAQSSFIITGRGGLPPNPKDILTPDAIQVDWVTLNPNIDNRNTPSISTNSTNSTPEPIVEATGWVFNAKGEVVFTADTSTTPRSSWQTPTDCGRSKSNP
ncbi:MAG: S-layer family protein [Scytonema sp. RU_4_4]|nr:S-layer family protein [Scytonema sp. RU_4_4]NJR73900.1 S-layer family protein [Scytonema sp. CRU_2_7]